MRQMSGPMLRGGLTLALLGGPCAAAAQGSPAIITRLQQLPTTELLRAGTVAGEWGETSTFGGQLAEGGGGSGNQTYQALVEIGVHSRLMLIGFFDGNDDPTYGLIAGRRWRKEFTTVGGGLRVLLGEAGPARFALEGSLATFGLRSEAGLFTNDTTEPRDYFTVGTVSAIASANFAPGWRATLTPSVTYLPAARDGVPFYGWTTLLGFGVDGRPHPLWHVFATSEFLLGPGDNSLSGDFDFQRTPLWSAGTVYEASPRVQVIAFLTNRTGAAPSTRHLTLLGEVPIQYGGRMRFTPLSSEKEGPRRAAMRVARSLEKTSGAEPLGGLQVARAAAMGAYGVDVSASIDDARSRSVSVRLGLSDELDFEMGVTRTPGLGALPTLGINLDEGTHYRVGTKLTLLSEDWGAPVTASARVSGGQDFVTQKGYLMVEAVIHRRLNDQVQVTLAPLLAHISSDVPVALGLSGVLGRPGRVQLILEPTLLLTGQSSLWTVGLRLPALGYLHPQLFATTTRSMLGIGRLLGDPDDVRVGATARVRMWGGGGVPR